MDYYKTLGVERNSTPDEIKKAYRKLASQYHPDKGGDTAKFQEIQKAYETLSDPQKKQQYDNPNPFNGHGQQGFHFNFNGAGPAGFGFHSQGFDINDLFGQMFGQRGNPFGHHFQQTFKTTIWISLEQVYTGGEQILQIQGQGGPQTIKVQIPKGIDNGAQLRYDNLIPGGVLIVEFRIHVHPKFDRQGQDLISYHRISVLDLIVGTKFDFITISGKSFEVQIKPGTQPDTTLRISGQGLPHMDQQGNGDQLILIKPFIPDNIDQSVVEAIKSQIK